jgi:hypothetical protein
MAVSGQLMIGKWKYYPYHPIEFKWMPDTECGQCLKTNVLISRVG